MNLHSIFPLFIQFRLLNVIDILLVAILLYSLYNLLKGTAAVNIFLGILAIFLIWRLVKALGMDLLSDLLGAFISVGFIAFIVVFQPEIRKFLLLIGTPGFMKSGRKRFLFWKVRLSNHNLENVDPVVQACHRMAMVKTGALIVIGRKNDLSEYTDTGILLESRITGQLIESIFYKNNPLHDGAVVIDDNKVLAARVILPVSAITNIPAELGLRHRSAIGITEKTDAVAIVVSEQTGRISYCREGILELDIKASGLKKLLEDDFAAKQ
jgi:diadenylate cyclase